MRRALIALFAVGFWSFASAAETASVVPALSAPLAAPLRLIIAGPPGSGKDTMAERLVQDYGVVHVRASALLGQLAESDPQVKAKMKQGILIAAPVIVKLMRARLAQPDVEEHGLLVNGFPRRIAEAKSYRQLLNSADALILLKVPQEELWRRVRARGREDADRTVFKRRMKIYRNKTVPAVAYMKTRVPVLAVDVSDRDIAGNYRAVKAKLENFLTQRRPPVR
jgi:adenylate kinase